jgi:GntR family transcriptional regulator/MocR family aminotransferase
MPHASASLMPPVMLDSDAPLYRQLTDWFRQAILDGRLRPSQRLPSTRGLAKELGISRIPVLSAYEQLLAEGYLESVVGAGTRVADSIPAKTQLSSTRRSEPMRPARPLRRVAKRVALTRLPAPMWLKNQGAFRVGLPALEHFPAKTWSRLITRHARKTSLEVMAYGEALGQLPFREAIAEYLGTFRGLRCEASQILVTTGSQLGLQFVAQALLDPGDKVWLEEPGYPGARQAFAQAGARLVPVRVDDEGLDVAHGMRRAADARLAYITPSHQFPLGVTLSATRRMALLDWAERSDAWIVEDDYDSEYRFTGRPLAALQGSDPGARVIYVGSFSKVMFPALRVGYVVVPQDLVEAFSVMRDATDTFTATLQQAAMCDFIREGHFARHLRRMRQLYGKRYTALTEAIRKELPGKLQVLGSETGMHLTALLPEGVDDVALTRRAAEAGVSVRPLSRCYLKPPTRGGLILGYGGADLEQIQEGVRILGSLLR